MDTENPGQLAGASVTSPNDIADSSAGLQIPALPADSDMLSAAVAWANAGFYVLPVGQGTKDPGSIVGKGWHTKSSRDPKQIAAWFAGTDHDIAVHCGRSGIVVLDVDTPGNVTDVIRPHLVGTPHQSTRPDTPGRAHYVFLQPPGRLLGNSTGKLAGGWGEVRGANGVIVVAPSSHAAGGRYVWQQTGLVPPLPDEIADKLPSAASAEDAVSDATVAAFLAAHARGDRPHLLQGWIKALGNHFGKGESRHQSLVSVLAGAMKEAAAGCYPAAVADEVLREMFLQAVAQPPTSGKQGAARVGAAAVAEYGGIRSWAVAQALTADPAETLARADAEMFDNLEWMTKIATDAPATVPAPAPAPTTGSVLERLSRDGAWLDRQEFAELEYAVPGIVTEGMGLLVSPPKKGKSFLVGDIGLAVAAGGVALGSIRVQRRPVLYLALEDGHRRLQNRFRRILSGGPIPDGMHVITTATPEEAFTAMHEFLTRHAALKPLVILDTFGKVKPPRKSNQDAYQADYAIGSALKNLVDAVPGSTLLVVHHTRKQESSDFVDSVSGTYGVAGSADFVLALVRKRHENTAVLSVTGRDVIEAEYALTAVDGILWRLDGESLAAASGAVETRRAASRMGDRKMDVFRFVEKANEVVTPTDVARGLDGIDGDTAGQYLRRLADDGLIVKVVRGQYLRRLSEVSEVSESQVKADD